MHVRMCWSVMIFLRLMKSLMIFEKRAYLLLQKSISILTVPPIFMILGDKIYVYGSP